MLRVDQSLSFLNDMLHHPSMFRLDPLKQMYVSKSTLNSGVKLDNSTLFLPYHLLHYKRLQSNLHANREFLIFLVFKLLERGVYISARNVAILETPTARALHQLPEQSNPTTEFSGVPAPMQSDGCDPPEHDENDHRVNDSNTNRKIVHCDIIAFNAKKKHVYAIVLCDDILKFQQCRAHALRIVNSIRHIIPPYSTVIACVLTVYNFEHEGNMRLCVVTNRRQSLPLLARSQPKRNRCSARIRDRAQHA
jgi:hypothetical protein